jgi:GT2 family glycosyltransferase
MNDTELSIVIVNWNTRQDLLQCLASIEANPPGCTYEVLVFDNGSSDGSREAVTTEAPHVRLLASRENLGFARANNRAVAQARGQYWLLLNPDTIVSPGAIDVLLEALAGQPRVAAVGPKLVTGDGSVQISFERLPSLANEWWRLLHLERIYPSGRDVAAAIWDNRPRRVEVLAGACLLLRREAVGPAGLFDEEYFVYSEEIDLCDRWHQAGWELQWVPQSVITHFGGQSTRLVADQMFVELYRNKVKFFRKRRGSLSATLYKLILLQAALVRLGLGQLMRLLPMGRRSAWIEIGRQYGLLLSQLPKL